MSCAASFSAVKKKKRKKKKKKIFDKLSLQTRKAYSQRTRVEQSAVENLFRAPKFLSFKGGTFTTSLIC